MERGSGTPETLRLHEAVVLLLSEHPDLANPVADDARLAVAALMDLALAGRLALRARKPLPIGPARFVANDAAPTDAPALDALLAWIAARPRSQQDALAQARERAVAVRAEAQARLAARGCCTLLPVWEGDRAFQVATVDVRAAAVAELREKVRRVAATGTPDDARTYALVLLLRATPERFRSLLTADEVRALAGQKSRPPAQRDAATRMLPTIAALATSLTTVQTPAKSPVQASVRQEGQRP